MTGATGAGGAGAGVGGAGTGAGGAGAGGLGSAGKMSAGVTGHLSLALLKNVKFRYRPTNAPFRNKYILPQRPVTAPIQNND